MKNALIFLIAVCSPLQGVEWVQTSDLSAPGQVAANNEVAVDQMGNAIAVWRRSNGTNWIIQGATLQCGETIWTPTNDLSLPGENATLPQIACDATGNALAVWQRGAGADQVIQGARLPPGSSTWVPTDDLTLPGLRAQNPAIAVAWNGNAVAVWERHDAAGDNMIQGATLVPGSNTWVPTADLSLPGDNNTFPLVQVDPTTGNAVALWTRRVGTLFILQGATLSFGSTTWVPTNDLAVLGPTVLLSHLTIDENGNAVAVWPRNNGTNLVIEGATLPVGSSTWVPTSDLSTPGQFADRPRVGVDQFGNAVAVWMEDDGSNDIIQGARLPFGSSTWVPTSALSTTGENAARPDIGVERGGKAVAVWYRFDGSTTIIQGAQLAVGSNIWVPTNDLSSVGDNASNPKVGVSSNACTVAVWRKLTVQGAVMIIVPEPPEPAPPTNFRGQALTNVSLTEVDYIHHLSWSASPDPTVVGYCIRSKMQILATIPSTKPLEATFHNQRPDRSVTYSLSAFDDEGHESSPLKWTFPKWKK